MFAGTAKRFLCFGFSVPPFCSIKLPMTDGTAQESMTGLSGTVSLKGRQMAAVRTQHTAPEVAVRKAMHARGLRFRLHRRDLPGRPDIVLAKHRTVVFVHGCFWHGCTVCDRGTRRPKSNAGFWSAKLDENRRRDDRNTAELTRLGWRVPVVWECETRDSDKLAEALDRILNFVPSKRLNDG